MFGCRFLSGNLCSHELYKSEVGKVASVGKVRVNECLKMGTNRALVFLAVLKLLISGLAKSI